MSRQSEVEEKQHAGATDIDYGTLAHTFFIFVLFYALSDFRRTTFIRWSDPCPGTGSVPPSCSSSGSIGRLVQGILELLRFHRFGLRRAYF